jgi:hypothetical protein
LDLLGLDESMILLVWDDCGGFLLVDKAHDGIRHIREELLDVGIIFG